MLNQFHQIVRLHPHSCGIVIWVDSDFISGKGAVQVETYLMGIIVQNAQGRDGPRDKAQNRFQLLRRGKAKGTQAMGFAELFQVNPLITPCTVSRKYCCLSSQRNRFLASHSGWGSAKAESSSMLKIALCSNTS